MSDSEKIHVNKTYSSSSTSSTNSIQSSASTGIGSGILNETRKEDLPPSLTPEGLSVNSNLKIYDSIVYLIYCPEHDKVAVTNVERARCVWLPFTCLSENQKWTMASKNGVDAIIGRKDAEMDAAESAKKAPVYDIQYLNILRIQLPTETQFVTRLAMLVVLKKSPTSIFQCCQSSNRINWIRASDILGDRIDKIWGPELKNFTKLLVDIKEEKERKLITEFSLENSFYHYMSKENTVEKKLLKTSHIKLEHITEIYENFIEHCYPSFYMSFESYKYYMVKFGFDRNDQRLPFLFNASSLYNNDFLHFHEVLLGIIAMEPSTKPFAEGRLNFIFRYYDTSNEGFLHLEEFYVLILDILKSLNNGKEPNETEMKIKVEEGIKCVGLRDGKVSKENFIKAVLSGTFKNTESLCRSPKPILPQISRLIQGKIDDKGKPGNESFLVNKRANKGSCFRCRDQSYEYNLHCVTFDTLGRCVKPTIISDQWIEIPTNDTMNLHKYSIDCVFNTNWVANVFVDFVKEFYHKTKFEGCKLEGLMAARDDWTVFSRYFTILCENLKSLLMHEDKLIKINSPAIIIGDLQGSLHDLFIIEKFYFQSFPTLSNNLVFLGNMSGVSSHGTEVIAYLFALKLLAPNKVFLLRGTNEMNAQNRQGLKEECYRKYGQDYGKKIHEILNEIFAKLPFAIIIDESIFCCHSGIPKFTKIEKLNQMSKDVENVVNESLAYELLVNMPDDLKECFCAKGDQKNLGTEQKSSKSLKKQPSQQLGVNTMVGVTGFTASEHYLNACTFDQTALENFLKANNFTHFIRSHSQLPKNECFDVRYNNACITVFSFSGHKSFTENSSKNASLTAVSNKKNQYCSVAFVDGSNQRIRIMAFETDIDLPSSLMAVPSVI